MFQSKLLITEGEGTDQMLKFLVTNVFTFSAVVRCIKTKIKVKKNNQCLGGNITKRHSEYSGADHVQEREFQEKRTTHVAKVRDAVLISTTFLSKYVVIHQLENGLFNAK